jgi:hypothetical protein
MHSHNYGDFPISLEEEDVRCPAMSISDILGLQQHSKGYNYGGFSAFLVQKDLRCPFVHYFRHKLAPE